MIDTLVRMRDRIAMSDVVERLGLTRGEYILVTLHRPALVDGDKFESVLDSLGQLSRALPIVFPVHPRTRVRLGTGRLRPASLLLIDPVGYIEFLALESSARAVVTDSGGVQEETTYLGIPCFTMRMNTERPVTVEHGTNRLIGIRPEALTSIPMLLESTIRPEQPPEGWDGRAAGRAARILLAELRGDVVDAVVSVGH